MALVSYHGPGSVKNRTKSVEMADQSLSHWIKVSLCLTMHISHPPLQYDELILIYFHHEEIWNLSVSLCWPPHSHFSHKLICIWKRPLWKQLLSENSSIFLLKAIQISCFSTVEISFILLWWMYNQRTYRYYNYKITQRVWLSNDYIKKENKWNTYQ